MMGVYLEKPFPTKGHHVFPAKPSPKGRRIVAFSLPAEHDSGDSKGPTPSLPKAAYVSVIAASSFVVIGHAQAGDNSWKPRRHTRHIGEPSSPHWAHNIVQEEERLSVRVAAENKRYEQLRREREQLEAKRRAEEEKSLVWRQQQLMQSSARPSEGFINIGGVEISTPSAIGLGVVFFLVALFQGKLLPGQRRGGSGGGRWVYDRSLGGKKVWVPDGTPENPVAKRSALTDSDLTRLSSIAATAAAGATTPAPPPAPTTYRRPTWWDAPPALPVDPSTQRSLSTSATNLLRRMEAGKNMGQDYRAEELVGLRNMCQEGQVTVLAKTVGGRDALFLAGVEAAVRAAADPVGLDSDKLGDITPLRLVCGLCADLEMPEERAAATIRNSVAAFSRARILAVLSALKRTEVVEAAQQISLLINVLREMPVLTPDGKEAQLIGESLTMSVDETARWGALDLADSLAELPRQQRKLLVTMLGLPT